MRFDSKIWRLTEANKNFEWVIATIHSFPHIEILKINRLILQTLLNLPWDSDRAQMHDRRADKKDCQFQELEAVPRGRVAEQVEWRCAGPIQSA